MALFVHAGFSVVRGTLHNLDASVDSHDTGGQVQQEFRSDGTLTITTPSARLGVAVFF
jgi:hypothetical protein